MNSFPLPQPATIKPTRILSLEHYSEGPVIDVKGNLYISHGISISKLNLENTITTWARSTAPNGHKIMPNGNHLVCDGKQHAVLKFDQDGHFINNAAGGSCYNQEIISPNDLCLHPGIGFYFTDSLPEKGVVYFVSMDGKQRVVAHDLDVPNGIVLSPDCRKLYVAESHTNRVLIILLDAPGQAAHPPEVFANLPCHSKKKEGSHNMPDGMALDSNGRLWIAHYGMSAIQVLSPEGQLLATYNTGIRCTSNICFAGNKLSTVFITGGDGEPGPGALVRLDVQIPGLPILPGGH